MRLIPNRNRCSTSFLLLAPPACSARAFPRVDQDSNGFQARLAEAQQLRGRIYLAEGAVHPWQLARDGRHVQTADFQSWHLLTLNARGSVAACMRYLPHSPDVTFDDLGIYHSELARSEWSQAMRQAVETELAQARVRGLTYAEVGGWAISEELRGTTEALRMAVAIFSLANLLGGALGVTTATTRHRSSSILRRLGGRPLEADGVTLPAYYDPKYQCDMEILQFDCAKPNPDYVPWITTLMADLKSVRVLRTPPDDGSGMFALPASVRDLFPVAEAR